MILTEYLSPKDGIVVSVAVLEGARVAQGDIVLTLSSDEEDLHLARLASLSLLRQAFEARLTDDALGPSRRLAQTAIEVATQAGQIATDTVTQIENGVLLGRPVVATSLASAISSAITLQSQKTEATLQQEVLERQIIEAKAINELLRTHLSVETAAANAAKDATVIKAIAAGTVTFEVTNQAVVKTGDILFRIH